MSCVCDCWELWDDGCLRYMWEVRVVDSDVICRLVVCAISQEVRFLNKFGEHGVVVIGMNRLFGRCVLNLRDEFIGKCSEFLKCGVFQLWYVFDKCGQF